ncbi:MAG: type I-B CRISPR-associated protein Cas7/Csh2, partial [bacterium]|nr:type I-B CRISPR-associated protein Cas7/Csh2 [bacterium]
MCIRDSLRTKEKRLDEFRDNEELIEKCIDVRLFGATTAVKEKTMTLTGPVQFKYGYSLHRVDLTYVKGTTVMPSAQDRRQGTFTEKYILPYSLIVFYGIVNENAVRAQNIPLTEDDIEVLLEAMWNGTKNLISTSKVGQMPRLLMQVIHKESNYHIGELDRRVKFISSKNDEEIRDIADGVLDITELVGTLNNNKDSILKVRYKVDERLKLLVDGKEVCFKDVLTEVDLEELPF